MTREIKFRFWDTELNRMGWFDFNNASIIHNDKKWPVMQFTGLTDKNGKEIFEGDVLNVYHRPTIIDPTHRGHRERGELETLVGAVIFEPGMLLVQGDDMSGHLVTWIADDDVEVIGNIYSNPELPENESKEL